MELTSQLLMILLPVIILQLVLLFIALRDWMRQPKTMPNRMVWLVLILFIQTFGAVFYFVAADRITKEDTWLDE